jgi:hypothetical protein
MNDTLRGGGPLGSHLDGRVAQGNRVAQFEIGRSFLDSEARGLLEYMSTKPIMRLEAAIASGCYRLS